MAKAPFRRGVSVCIFCGCSPTTREHIWAQWAHPLFPDSPGYNDFVHKGMRRSEVVSRVKDYTRTGSVKTLRPKLLCKTCNGVWLGNTFEDKLKQELTKLFTGQPLVMGPKVIDAMTTYIVAKLLVLDWKDREPVTSLEDTRAFYKSRTMPPGLALFIFNCIEGDWQSAFRAFTCALTTDKNLRGTPAPPPNTKALAVGLGNLFVFAIISTSVSLNCHFGQDDTIRLWPNGVRAALWPPKNAINSIDAQTIAETLDRVHASPQLVMMD